MDYFLVIIYLPICWCWCICCYDRRIF